MSERELPDGWEEVVGEQVRDAEPSIEALAKTTAKSVTVSFVQSCTFEMSVFGKSVI